VDLRERQRPSAASPRLERSVTVVIVTRNRRDELTRTVGLLGELTPAAPVIVVDNGSHDGSADAVAAGYPRVRLVRSRSNLGALGRNLAVRGVQTRYCASGEWCRRGSSGACACWRSRSATRRPAATWAEGQSWVRSVRGSRTMKRVSPGRDSTEMSPPWRPTTIR
jgi:Glycosyl transferase family 2